MEESIEPSQTTGVLLMAYGGPDSLDDVEPYLLDVRGGRETSPELVEEIRHRYASIGGRSPLLELTRAQARALEERLNSTGGAGDGRTQYRAYVGMRHWKPYIRDAVGQMVEDGIDRVVALCMAPQASTMSTGAYRRKLDEARQECGGPEKVAFVSNWHTEPGFIGAIAEKVTAAAGRFSPGDRDLAHYLFTAHSLPAAIVKQGDPYQDQIQETVRLVTERLGLDREQWDFAFQSAGAAGGQWLGPAIEQVLPEFAGRGIKNLVVMPVGFVADHVEVLYDLDVEARRQAQELGMRLERGHSLNASPTLIEALAAIVEREAITLG